MTLTEQQLNRLAKLEALFAAVCELTTEHDGLHFHGTEGYNPDIDIAVVYPNKLAVELEKVDPKWYDERERRINRLVESRGMNRRAAEIVISRAMADV